MKYVKIRIFLTRIFQYKDRIVDSVFIRENTGQENPHSAIFYAVNNLQTKMYYV